MMTSNSLPSGPLTTVSGPFVPLHFLQHVSLGTFQWLQHIMKVYEAKIVWLCTSHLTNVGATVVQLRLCKLNSPPLCSGAKICPNFLTTLRKQFEIASFPCSEAHHEQMAENHRVEYIFQILHEFVSSLFFIFSRTLFNGPVPR